MRWAFFLRRVLELILLRTRGVRVVATGCVVAVIALPGCGGGEKPFTSSDVERAFRSAGIELTDLNPSPPDTNLLTQIEPDPVVVTILGIGNSPLGIGKNSPKFLTVSVFRKTRDAKSWESAEKREVADLKAHPAKYPGSFPAKTIETARVRNVVVLVVNRTTSQQVSRGIRAALDNLRG